MRFTIRGSIFIVALVVLAGNGLAQDEKKPRKKGKFLDVAFAGKELRLPEGWPRDFVFSHDGAKVAVGVEAKVVVFNLADGTEATRMQLPAKTWQHHLAFAADDKTILWHAAEDTKARVFDAKTGRQLREFDHPSKSMPRTASPDGTRLVYSTYEGVEVMDVASGKVHLRFDKEECNQAAFSPDGKILALFRHEKGVRLHDAATGKLLHSLTNDADKGSGFYYLTFSPDGTRLAAWGRVRESLDIWDVKTGKLVTTLTTPATYTCVRFTRDNKFLLGVYSRYETNLHDIAQNKRVFMFFPPRQPDFAAFSPDEKKVLVSGVSSGAIGSRYQYSIFVHDRPMDAKE